MGHSRTVRWRRAFAAFTPYAQPPNLPRASLTKSDTVTPSGRTSSYGLHDTAGPTTHLPGGGMQAGAGKLYALTDRLGSTRATTTAQGVVSECVRYDAAHNAAEQIR